LFSNASAQFKPGGSVGRRGAGHQRVIVTCAATLAPELYDMLVPETPVTVNTVVLDERLRLPLASVQLPLLPVTQLLVAPGAKLPVTVALATVAFVPVSKIVTVACACHAFGRFGFPVVDAPVVIDLTATVSTVGGGVVVPPPVPSVYSSRFGEPVPAEPTTPVVALDVSSEAMVAGEAPGLACAISAAVPVTCGVAMEVPLIVLVAVLLVFQADVMLLPGAKMSTQVPKLEYDARESVLVVAPTVTALGSLEGE
jgi:hypothetical protein